MITTKVAADETDTVSKMARRFQRQPAYVMRGHADDGFYAAQWRLPARRIATECVTGGDSAPEVGIRADSIRTGVRISGPRQKQPAANVASSVIS